MQFKLFHEEDKASMFWLQSLDDPELLFSVADPDMLGLSYEVTLSEAEQSLLQVAAGDELLLAVTLNTRKRLGLQKQLQEFETSVAIRGR